MWNRASSRRPVTAFTIPHDERPEPVAAAFADFERVGDENGELHGRIHDLQQALKDAPRVAQERLVEATLAGEAEPKDLHKAAQKIEAELEALRFKLTASDRVVDVTGNRLAEKVGTERDGWIEKLEIRRADQARRYAEAVAVAEAEGAELAKVNGEIDWLRAFATDEAVAGQVPSWHGGGRLDVVEPGTGRLSGEFAAAELLALAAKAGEPPTVRGPRGHVVAGGSSMR